MSAVMQVNISCVPVLSLSLNSIATESSCWHENVELNDGGGPVTVYPLSAWRYHKILIMLILKHLFETEAFYGYAKS